MSMKLRFSLIVLCFGWVGTVEAAVKDCFEIKSDMDRLTCYDREAGFNPVVKLSDGKGNWRVREEISKIDDSQNVHLRLKSTEETNCRYESGSHDIGISCRENETSIYFLFAGCFMSDVDGGDRVTYRIDKQPASTIEMAISTNNMALGLWHGGRSIPLLKKLFGAKKLLIRAQPFSDSAVTGEYEISGLSEAIKPLRNACNW